jgi:hypothetical protein
VVLAHETSHLLHNHAWWLLAADLAAAANPLLRPTARTAARCVERWAARTPPPPAIAAPPPRRWPAPRC